MFLANHMKHRNVHANGRWTDTSIEKVRHIRTPYNLDSRSQFMDFLKSAVASAIAKGPLAAYSVGDRVDVESSIWTVNNATKRV